MKNLTIWSAGDVILHPKIKRKRFQNLYDLICYKCNSLGHKADDCKTSPNFDNNETLIQQHIRFQVTDVHPHANSKIFLIFRIHKKILRSIR